MSAPTTKTEGEFSGMERHLQSAIQIILVGIMGWCGMTIQSMTETVARLDERVKTLQFELARVQDTVADATKSRYMATDAERDFGSVNRRLDQMDSRLKQIEERRR